ncbi:MAG TPA: formylglycine-generating enzyme family protein [Sedimentisphaerales bacterium]|nr:formylglycine-generating enzyme family protein [Sedimentisphaerales bacterium]
MATKSAVLMAALLFVFAGAGRAFAACPSADLTGDCFVDFEDFAVMARQWLTGPNTLADMVQIPGGEFQMGRHVGDGMACELPLHAVLLDSFFMSKFEITNSQYCDFLNSADVKVDGGTVYVYWDTSNSHPYCDTHSISSYSQIDYSGGVFSVRTKGGRDMSDDPMVMVSWYGAAAYCNWRSRQEGYDACYNLSTWDCDFSKHGYRLPTEAEWEYAARGGQHSPYYRFPWGDTISHSQANYYSSSSYSYDISPTRGYHPTWNDGTWPYTAPAGSFLPNGYTLYDMTGNVSEWCNDWFTGAYYSTSPYDNPKGPASGDDRVLRGGSYSHDAYFCRVACRYADLSFPHFRQAYGGFRVVLHSE